MKRAKHAAAQRGKSAAQAAKKSKPKLMNIHANLDGLLLSIPLVEAASDEAKHCLQLVLGEVEVDLRAAVKQRAVKHVDFKDSWIKLVNVGEEQNLLKPISGQLCVESTEAKERIIVTGLTLAFGDTSGGFRRLIQIVFGLSIAFAASSFFLSFFSFGGGALIA